MKVTYGSQDNFSSLIQGDLVLVDFFATWCGPCKMLSPVLEELSEERDNVKIVKIDIDENADLARSYGIMSVPTMILFKNGQQVGMKNGYMPKQVISEWIEENR